VADEEASYMSKLIDSLLSDSEELLNLTNYECLCSIYAIQNFIRANNNRSGKFGESYGPGFFTNRCQYSGIFRESRKVVMRLIRSPCIICSEPLSYNSEGDHVVPVSKGGRDNISNFIPLCKRHNASKGNRDLMEWGIQKQFIDRFSPDVLCTYARETFLFEKENGELNRIAPDFLKIAIIELANLYLPGGTNQNYWNSLIESIKID
jgi:5-methylcytosine-specific restriction endonuclease McrA